MVILTDDEDRENEGDLVLPAQFITPEAITFMLTVARGYMCLALTETDCDRLDLHPQAAVNTSVRGTPMTVSIDGHPAHGFTTGVSAGERAKTIRMTIDPRTGPSDFVRPGHINPLRARDGGVLVRTGQTEGSVDLCKLAGLYPGAVIIEIMRDDGEMARRPDLEVLSKQHGIRICSVAQVIEHRLARESLVRRMTPAQGTPIRTPHGEFNVIAFESLVDPLPHLALTMGDVGALDAQGNVLPVDRPTLVRMHRRNVLGDIFGDLDSSSTGPTGETLHRSMQMIAQAGHGAVVYLRPSGIGDASLNAALGLDHQITTIRRTAALAPDADAPDLTATNGSPSGASGPAPSLREFGIGGQILRGLGLGELRLISDSTKELPGLEAFGLRIRERVSVSR